MLGGRNTSFTLDSDVSKSPTTFLALNSVWTLCRANFLDFDHDSMSIDNI